MPLTNTAPHFNGNFSVSSHSFAGYTREVNRPTERDLRDSWPTSLCMEIEKLAGQLNPAIKLRFEHYQPGNDDYRFTISLSVRGPKEGRMLPAFNSVLISEPSLEALFARLTKAIAYLSG